MNVMEKMIQIGQITTDSKTGTYRIDRGCRECQSTPAKPDPLFQEGKDFFHNRKVSFTSMGTYRGYHLLACDGSDLAIAHNPEDKDTHRRHNSLSQ